MSTSLLPAHNGWRSACLVCLELFPADGPHTLARLQPQQIPAHQTVVNH
jgi:hypothetical protein